jgi:hypothetical protein
MQAREAIKRVRYDAEALINDAEPMAGFTEAAAVYAAVLESRLPLWKRTRRAWRHATGPGEVVPGYGTRSAPIEERTRRA